MEVGLWDSKISSSSLVNHTCRYNATKLREFLVVLQALGQTVPLNNGAESFWFSSGEEGFFMIFPITAACLSSS